VAEQISPALSVPGASPAVSISDVSKTFDGVTALDGLSFYIRRGEMFGLIGPDGAGKTTLLRILCGLLAPDRGEVRVLGADPLKARAQTTAAIGYVSQRFSLYGDLSIDENIEFFSTLHGVHDFEANRTRLLSLTGLEPFRHRLADRLSGGMKQKLALACTLIHEPSLLVLDEPTTGVDPVSRREFWKLLAESLTQGRTIVLATPYLDEAERCGRVALVSEGRLLALDEPARLQTGMAGTVFEVTVAQPRRALEVLRRTFGGERVQLFGDRLHVRAQPESGAAITSGLDHAGFVEAQVRPITPSLEDVFITALAAGRSAGRGKASDAHEAPT
jgi:ABC-2 type transport system ATP-binding protein